MKNLLFSGFVFGTLLFSFGCTEPAPTPVKFNLERPFTLKVGQSGQSADIQGFTIKLDQVSGDSRCPRNVECITAGKVDIGLTLSKAGESKTVTLPFTIPDGTSNFTDFNGHTVRVVGVVPFKMPDKEIKPEDYSITLTVIKTPPPPPKIKLGENFTLGIGESIATSDDLSGLVRFDSVVGDSRCPDGTKCIWAGKADCLFSLTTNGATQQVTLSTGDMSKGGKSEIQFGTKILKIIAVGPTPKQGVPMPHKAYKATLVLTE